MYFLVLYIKSSGLSILYIVVILGVPGHTACQTLVPRTVIT